MYDERTSKGFIRRWSLMDGRPHCLEDAIPLADPETPNAIGRNTAIFSLLAELETYREASADPDAPPPEASDLVKALDLWSTPHEPVEDPEAEQAAMDARASAADLVQAHVAAAPPIAPVYPIPAVVSDRQFFHAAALMGVITPAEALAAVSTGAIPALLEDIVTALPEGPQFDARMVLSGAIEFRREHPLVNVIGDTLGWTSAQVDNLYRLAGALE